MPKFPRKCWTEVFRFVRTKKRAQKLLIWLNAILKAQEIYPYAIFFLGIDPETREKKEDMSSTEKRVPVLEELVHLFLQAEDEDRRPVIISKVLDLLNSSQSLCDLLFELGSDRFRRLRLEVSVLSVSHSPDFYAALELLKVLYPHLLQQSESNLLHVLNQSQQAANIFTCWMMEGSTTTQSFTQDLSEWKTLACPGHEEYLSIKYRFIEKDVDFLVELYVTASQTRMLAAVTDPVERMLWDYRAAEIENLRVISKDCVVQRIQYHMNNRTRDFFIQLKISRPSEDRVVVTHTLADPFSTNTDSLGDNCSYTIDLISPQATFTSSNSPVSPPSSILNPIERCKLIYFVRHDSEVKEMFVPDFLGETGDFRKAWIKLKAYLERGDKRDLGGEFGSMSEAVAMKTLKSPHRKLNPRIEDRVMQPFWTHKEARFATERI